MSAVEDLNVRVLIATFNSLISTPCYIQLFSGQDLPPRFKPVLFNLYGAAIALAKTILQLMGHALQLEVTTGGFRCRLHLV